MNLHRSQFIKKMINILWVSLIVFISIVPYYYTSESINPTVRLVVKYFPFFLIILISISTYFKFGRVSLSGNHFSVERYSNVFMVILLHTFICFISLWDAGNVALGFTKLIYFTISGPWLALLIIYSFKNLDEVEFLTSALSTTGCMVAGYGCYAYITGNNFVWDSSIFTYVYHDNLNSFRATSTLGNALYLGAYCTLLIPFYFWEMQNRKDYKRYLFYGGLLLTVLALFLTLSRGALISGLFVITISTIYGRKNILIFFLLSLSLLALFYWNFPEMAEKLAEDLYSRVESLKNFAESESFRLGQFETAAGIIQKHFFLGIGFGNFVDQYEMFRSESVPRWPGSKTTENMYLMILCETGILGIVTFLLSAVAILIRFFYDSKSATSDIQKYASIAVLGLLVNMFTWDLLNQPTLRMLFWIVVGIGLSGSRRSCIVS